MTSPAVKPLKNTDLAPDLKQGFEEFYYGLGGEEGYPRKRDLKRTQRAYAIARTKATHEEIIAGLRAQLPAMRARIAAGDVNFIPHPTTWLNNDRWLPEVDPNLALNGHSRPLVSDAMRAAMEPRP